MDDTDWEDPSLAVPGVRETGMQRLAEELVASAQARGEPDPVSWTRVVC